MNFTSQLIHYNKSSIPFTKVQKLSWRQVRWTVTGNSMFSGDYGVFLGVDRQTKWDRKEILSCSKPLTLVIGYPRPIPRRQWYVGVLVHHKCLDTMLRLTRFSVGVMNVSRSASPHGGRRTSGVLEGAAAHGVRVVFTFISHLQTD
jgi:hypothetical protein